MTNEGRSICTGVLVLVAAGLAFIGAPLAHGSTGPGRNSEAERGFAAELDAIESGLGQAFMAATAALDRAAAQADDKVALADAQNRFKQIVERAPAHAPSLWRLSGLARMADERDDAIALARRAVAANAVWQAQLTLVEALLMPPAAPADQKEADELLEFLRRNHPVPAVALMALQRAFERGKTPEIVRRIQDLEDVAPELPQTHYFKAMRLADADELEAAGAALAQAVALGFPRAQADELAEKTGIAAHARRWRWVKRGAVTFGVWLAGLLILFVAGRGLSGAVLDAVESAAGDPALLERKTHGYRRLYGWLIGVGAAYFYISIPIVLASVVLLAGGVIMAFVAIGHIPIKLTLLVGIGALISVWAMLKSLFVRGGSDEPPGRLLPEAEAPGLWALLRTVAVRVKTRPVDAVYLTMGTDLAVIETGSMAARVRDRGKRSLILGVGVLADMTVSQLAAILAHEYGHFSNRDTARGDVALAVQSSLFRSAVGIAQGGGATWFNPAWLFVNGFHGLYLRITHGASRLQEVMADRFAAMAYGAQAFADGLVHAIRRSLEFSRGVNTLVVAAQSNRQPIANLYAPAAIEPAAVQADGAGAPEVPLDVALRNALEEAASPYDSHPPPAKRIEWVRRMAAAGEGRAEDSAQGGLAAIGFGAGQAAWDLFPSRETLEREMTDKANANLAAQGIIAGA